MYSFKLYFLHYTTFRCKMQVSGIIIMKKAENYAIRLSETLKELRHSFSYTQKQVAEKLHITYQSYQAYERQTALPSLPVFIALAELYDVSLDFLIGRKEY